MTATTKLTDAATGGAMIVDWVLNGSQIKPQALRTLLIKHGFDATKVPTINQGEAVKRVARNWRQTHEGYSSKLLKSDNADEVMISVRKDKPGARRNDAIQFCTVTFDKVNNQWAVYSCPAEHQGAVSALMAKCDRERTHLDCDWIRPNLIQDPLKAMGSVSFIRSSGGAQVVAAVHADEVNRISDLICAIGDCYMGSVSADLSQARTAQAMERSVQRGIMVQVDAARADLAAWRERGTRLPSGSIGTRIAQFKDLRVTVQMFAGCLQMRADDLLAELKAAEADARDLLDIAMGITKPAAAPAAEVAA